MRICKGMIHHTQYGPERHRRRSIRLKGYDYSQAGVYFVTICTKNRDHYLGNIARDKMGLSRIGRIIGQFWIAIPDHFNNAHLDEYIIMPNHLHGIITIDLNCRGEVSSPKIQGRGTLPLQEKRSLGDIIGYFKYQSTKYVNEILQSPGKTIWQRNYYEHVIRNEDELNRIREYIQINPLKWQFDRENPDRIENKPYQDQWKWLERGVYLNPVPAKLQPHNR